MAKRTSPVLRPALEEQRYIYIVFLLTHVLTFYGKPLQGRYKGLLYLISEGLFFAEEKA